MEKVTHSVNETEALAAQLAMTAERGWVIGLYGDLGAGKTAFVRGFSRGLGFPGRVHSPTFALLNEYSGGRWPIFHLDLYRIDSSEAAVAAGLEEYLVQPGGITLVEWAERWNGERPTPSNWRHVQMRFLSENDREVIADWQP